ncbi:hypothetical protein STEG23_021225 [Scotinomys teguina]
MTQANTNIALVEFVEQVEGGLMAWQVKAEHAWLSVVTREESSIHCKGETPAPSQTGELGTGPEATLQIKQHFGASANSFGDSQEVYAHTAF